jgi:hypothetical protein
MKKQNKLFLATSACLPVRREIKQWGHLFTAKSCVVCFSNWQQGKLSQDFLELQSMCYFFETNSF